MRSSLARGAVCIFLGLCGVLSLADGASAEGWDPSTHVLAGSEVSVQFVKGATVRFRNGQGEHLLFPGSTSPITVQIDGRNYFLVKDLPFRRTAAHRGISP